MLLFAIRRLLWAIPVLLLACAFAFVLTKAVYGDSYSNDPKLTETTQKTLEAMYGLDKSWPEQYWTFVGNAAQGDFGVSTKTRTAQRVNDVIWPKFFVSMQLGVAAFVLALIIGTTMGVTAALKEGSWVDHTLTSLAMLPFAIPLFVIATYWIAWFPDTTGWDEPLEKVGPIVVLSLALLPYFSQLIRASMLETMRADYVTTARAKGLSRRTTVLRHMVRNSLIPMITNAGPLFGFVITGSFIVERILIVPGMADLFVRSFSVPVDLNMVLATTVLFSFIIIIVNVFVDIGIALLDPRVTHD